MGTTVTIKIITDLTRQEAERKLIDAFRCIRQIELACSRFDNDSEVMRLAHQVGIPIKVSPPLFHIVRFALQVARLSDGAYNPTIGARLESLGFNRHYLTGETIQSDIPSVSADWQDVLMNEQEHTVLLRKPLILDLGAVAKGYAIDIAAKSLDSVHGFLINAGGDVYAGGKNEQNEPWEIGIRHPLNKNAIIGKTKLSNFSICTSGSYERRSPHKPDIHHLIHPATGDSNNGLTSCSVLAPFAMMADALSTAAFILGLAKGKEFLHEMGCPGIFISSDLQILKTDGLEEKINEDGKIFSLSDGKPFAL